MISSRGGFVSLAVVTTLAVLLVLGAVPCLAKEQEGKDDEKGEDGEGLARRNINPEDIFALQIVGDLPHDLTLTRDRLYRVDGTHTGEQDGAWKKAFSGDNERYITLQIADDRDDDLEITLHLDDPDVNYFKKSDFAGLLD